MLKSLFLAVGFTTAFCFAACAEDFKCSTPSAIAQLTAHFVDVALTHHSTEIIPEDKRAIVKQMRFPDGDPIVTFSDYIGTAVDESTKRCSATVHLSSKNRKSAEFPFTYFVSMTKDGNIIVKGDFVSADAYLIVFYDGNNGL